MDQRVQVAAALRNAAVLSRHRAPLDQVVPLVVCGLDGSVSERRAYLDRLLGMGHHAMRGTVELLCNVYPGSAVLSSNLDWSGDGLDTENIVALTQAVMQLERWGDGDEAWRLLLGLPALGRTAVVATLAMLVNSQAAQADPLDPASGRVPRHRR